MKGKTIVISLLIVISVFILGIKIFNPSNISIFVDGSETSIVPIPRFYTLTDAILILISTLVIGFCGAYLLFFDFFSAKEQSPVSKEKWKHAMKTLHGDELKLCELIMDADGVIYQGNLIKNSGFSKAKISRLLSLLESKGLVERKRRGMSNIIILR